MILLCGGLKGGVGKTTTAVHLAVYLSKILGKDTLLVDADDQESSSEWMTWRAEKEDKLAGRLTFCRLAGRSVRDEVLKLKEKYEMIVIDAGAGMRDSQKFAMLVADVMLVPFPASGLDVWTLNRVEKVLEEAQIYNPALRAYSFLMRAFPQGGENAEAAEALKESKVLNYIDTPVINRKCFAQAVTEGLTVFEVLPPNPKAVAEIEAVFQTAMKGGI
jgi:chromosome partitioning protein